MKRARRVVFLLLLVACNRERSGVAGLGRVSETPAGYEVRAPPPAPPAPATAQAPKPIRMIVRTATMSVIVKDADAALRNITAAVEAKGGYLAETKQWRENEQVRATASLRIPASGLSAMLAEIRKQAIRVESETISAQDISEEYTDLNAQLRNAEATEKELRDLLSTVRQRTQKAADILEVYEQLTKVRTEIERLKGRINYLSQTVALSTITVELVPDVLAKPVVQPGWRPAGIIREAARALIDTLKVLAAAGIWTLIYLLPLGLIFVIAALIVRGLWRLRRKPH